MITEIKLGVASVIRDALRLQPKCIHSSKLSIGEYFEFVNKIFIYIGKGKAIDQDGFVVSITDEYVRPIRVKLEYDYRLVREIDGTEVELK